MSRARQAAIGSIGIAGLLGLAGISSALTSAILAVGTIPFLAATEGPAIVTVQHLTVSPGDTVPWHYHTGDVWAVVKSGVLTEQPACSATELHNPGDAFHEEAGVVHEVVNAGTDAVDMYLTYVTPASQPRTVLVSAPVCIGPPLSANECFNGAWQTFTVPRMFRNEGDCVSYVESPRR